MDFEAALISRVLSSPEDYLKVVDSRVSSELFVDHSALWGWITESYRDHSGLPPEALVKERFPDFEFINSQNTPVSLFIDELKKRHVHNTIMEHQSSLIKFLKNKDPLAALEVMQECVLKVEKETRSCRDVSFTDQIDERLKQYEKAQTSGGITGIPTPWMCLNEKTQGFHEEELIMVAGRGGVGKCVAWDSEIQNPETGVLKTIQGVFSDSSFAKVVSWSDESGCLPADISVKVDTGTKTCFEYSLETGRSITVTSEHPFLTPSGWVKACLLDAGDYVGIPTKVPFPSKPVAMKSHEVDMLAVLLSEGGYTGKSVCFTSEDPHFVRLAFEASEGFGCSANQRKNEVITYDLVQPFVTSGRHTPNPVRAFLKQLGIDKTLAVHKVIPDCVFSLDRGQLARFISVFWMADGHVDTAPCLTLGSKKLVYQMQHLLLRYGIQSSVKYKPMKGGFHAWRLRVYSHCMEDFLISFSLWGDKLEKLKSLVHSRSLIKVNKNVGGPVWRNPLPVLKDVLWVKIEDVSTVPDCKIYDLSVDDTRCFVANDVIVHNTWAEVVLAWYNWKQGYRPLLFSKEMATWQIIRRLDAVHAKLPYNRFKAGMLTTDEYNRWRVYLADLHKWQPFWVVGDDDGFMGVTGIAAKIQRYKPHIVYIDGGYLIADDRKARDGWEQFKNVCWDLKRLALRERIPIVMTHQFSKEGKGLEGNADTLKYGDVQMWFDLIIGVYQDEALRTNKEMLFKINKHREGTNTEWVANWDLDFMNFDQKQQNDLSEGVNPYDKEGPVDY